MLTSAAGAYGPAVSEHLFACLLALCKKLPQYRDEQRNHHWTDRGTVKSLRNALVLVVGAGDIGTAFAGLCKAVGARTVGLKRTVGPVPAAFDALHPRPTWRPSSSPTRRKPSTFWTKSAWGP